MTATNLVTLGCDVSLAYPAFAILGVDGKLAQAIELDLKRAGVEDRSARIAGVLLDLRRRYRPGVVAIESAGGLKYWHSDKTGAANASGGAKMLDALGFARGLLWGALMADGFEGRIIELTRGKVCGELCRNSYATKVQVQENLRLRGYSVPTTKGGRIQDGIWDAIAVAIVGQSIVKLERLGGPGQASLLA